MRCRLYGPRRQVVRLRLQKTMLTVMSSRVIPYARTDGFFFPNIRRDIILRASKGMASFFLLIFFRVDTVNLY